MPIQHADARAGRLEAAQVRSMFDRVAAIYDPLNTAMTAGLHHKWRKRAADLAQLSPGSRALDVACGTGDLTLELAGRVGDSGEVVGCDFSENMLALARQKADKRFGAQASAARTSASGTSASETSASGAAPPQRASGVKIHFEWADALELPYADDSFDAATVGFGARNFSDLSKGLAEMARVVRPGGRVVVLDFTTPTRPPLSLFYRVWFDRIVPLLGRVTAPLAALLPKAGRDGEADVSIADAYAYLPSSVRRFLGPAELAAEMDRLGLVDIRYLKTAGGIVVIHAATVPM